MSSQLDKALRDPNRNKETGIDGVPSELLNSEVYIFRRVCTYISFSSLNYSAHSTGCWVYGSSLESPTLHYGSCMSVIVAFLVPVARLIYCNVLWYQLTVWLTMRYIIQMGSSQPFKRKIPHYKICYSAILYLSKL